MSLITPPAFTPAHWVGDTFFGHYCKSLQSIFVNRATSKEGLDQAVEAFITRQKLIETSPLDYGPILIFAEGTTTNNRNLLPFKRGGF